MRSWFVAPVFAFVLAMPLAAQQPSAKTPAPVAVQARPLAPVLPQWHSYQAKLPTDASHSLGTAAAASTDLTSEKIALLVLAAILVVVIVRTAK